MTIPGLLRYDLLAQHSFQAMPPDQQAQAIRRLAAAGHAEDVIARATGLSIEMVRRVLADTSHVQHTSGSER